MPVTTYVFGAGASVHASYPLASKMGQDFLEWLRPQSDVFGLRSYEKYFAGPNFESALNEMAKLRDKERLTEEEARDKVAFTYFGQQIRAWFEEIGTSKANAYGRFAGEIARAGDTFISFNYDICLEQALHRAGIWEVKDGYGFAIPGFERGSPTRLIKLHGSINWTIPINAGNPDRPVIVSRDCRALEYLEGSDESVSEPFFEAGPLLAVPTTEKKFYVDTSFGARLKEFWDHIWAVARDRLSKSDVVIICGYSLPLADKLAREVIFSSIRKTARIEIICGSCGDGIVKELGQEGFTQVAVAQERRFEDWVAAHSAMSR